MKIRLMAFFIFLSIVSSRAQSVAQISPIPSKAGYPNASALNTNSPPIGRDEAREEMQDITDRVLKLELEAVKQKTPKEGSGIVIAVIAGFTALIAALIGGGMTLLGQHITAKRERASAISAERQQLELARKQAVFQQTEKILEFRIKQMERFYAPMFALLKQSTALYNKMGEQLVQDEPTRYRALPKPDADGYTFQVLAKDGNTWKGFRLLDQLPAVKKNAKALTLVNKLICIGGQTTKIISEHAGLASSELIGLLGEYLAHYALLSTLYQSAETEPGEPLEQKTGYFSHKLSEKIEHEYHELSKFLDEFEAASRKMLADIQK